MVQLFSDRGRELQFLERHYDTGNAELVVLYGRRRVGKTELCLQFSRNKPHIYFLADRRPEPMLLQELKREMGLFIGDESFVKLALNDWTELFYEFNKWNKTRRPVVIIDEFPMLIESNHAVPSMFQKIWDQNLKDTDIMLILLGSSIAMMETEVLNYMSPLYGRRTAQWKVEHLQLPHLKPFFPKYDVETLVNVYSCVGGIPAYLQKLDPEQSFWENVDQKILSKGEFLYEEADFLLREELREPRNYSAILQAIAQGAYSYGDIINQTNMDKSIISRYTHILEDLGFTKRIYPIGAKPKPRKGQYVVSDNYLNFWFRYVFPNKSELESGDTSHTLNRIREDYPRYVGRVFEQTVLELLKEMLQRQLIPFSFTEIGRWWYKDIEIDLIALDEKERAATFLEIKWSNVGEQESHRVLSRLKAKTLEFLWDLKKECYGIIAKKLENKQMLRNEGYIALDLEDFEQL
jgi:AAA+ ATPase superfamily predicted ATPase